MTKKAIRRAVKRNARRRAAQGVGAAAGILLWAAAIGAYIVGENKLEQYRPKVEDLMAKGKGEIDEKK